MEGRQMLIHRVPDGVYQAMLHWKVENGAVYVLENGAFWKKVEVNLQFIPDFPGSLNAEKEKL